jgi:DNA-binding transcriptional regulator YhcF (GntR family)
MRQGQGVFVTEPQNVRPAHERRKALASLVERLMAQAREMGASPQEVANAVEAAVATAASKLESSQ